MPVIFLIEAVAYAGDSMNPGDPHYTRSGFFDVHICNWPDRAPFYMVLYSTENFEDIQSVDVSGANGKLIGKLDPEIYRLSENEPATRVLTSHIPISRDYEDGWFVAKIKMKNGEIQTATDLVIHKIMPEVSGHRPGDGAEDIAVPDVLTWDETFGAYWYRVFIRDNWNDRKLIYTSRLLPFPELDLPDGLLEPGGYYSWRVQARDEKGDPELGDFNTGSQSGWVSFSVRDD